MVLAVKGVPMLEIKFTTYNSTFSMSVEGTVLLRDIDGALAAWQDRHPECTVIEVRYWSL
jgi:hypothetical protein